MRLDVPKELLPEVATMTQAEAEELLIDFEVMETKGIPRDQMVRELVAAGWSPEFSEWYSSFQSRPAAAHVYFALPPSESSDRVRHERSRLVMRATCMGLLGLVMEFSILMVEQTPTRSNELIGIFLILLSSALYVGAGVLIAKAKGKPAYFGGIALVCCRIFGLAAMFFLPDSRAIRECP